LGAPLKSRQKIYWRVKAWDELDKKSDWSELAWWEMGFLLTSDWSAKWIDPETQVNTKVMQPVSYLRKQFNIGGNIKKARLIITCHGVYEVYLNGKRVGDLCFMPGITSYHHRLQYQVYDIAPYLDSGTNAIGVVLGDGWWRGNNGGNNVRNTFGERIALLAQLEIDLESDEHLTITSDNSWVATSQGPYRYSDLKIGDKFDARMILQNWDRINFDDKQWHPVRVENFGYENLIASMAPPIHEKERFTPNVLTTPDGSTVLDFKQNIAGILECKFGKLPKDQEIKLIYGETLDKEGNFTQNNFQNPKPKISIQYDIYIHSGEDIVFKNKFTIKGFRYVKITGHSSPIIPENFTAIAIYSDMEQTGDFHCSNDLINKLIKNTRWSQKGNFLDIPTDCPTRERSGWTGDAQIFTYAGSLLMQIAPLYRKWMKDISAEQLPTGQINEITPRKPPSQSRQKLTSFYGGAAGWGDAATIIPYTLWKMYANKQILIDQYESAKRWVNYERNRAKLKPLRKKINPKYWFGKYREIKQYIWDFGFQFGEWLEADFNPHSEKLSKYFLKVLKGNPEVATAYFAYSTSNLAKMARILGKSEDSEFYSKLSENIKKAYRIEFLLQGLPKLEVQAPHVRPVALEIIHKNQSLPIISKLNEIIKSKEYHLGTGFLSTPFILSVLTEYGYLDTAYKLLTQTTRPSWLYQITKGATTIWESWHAIAEDGAVFGSLNHYSYGAVVSWLFDTVAGIKNDPDSPGFKHFFIRPQPGGDLSYAEAEYDSIHGKIIANWKRNAAEGILIQYKFVVPPNTTATIIFDKYRKNQIYEGTSQIAEGNGINQINSLDSETRIEISAGQYEFYIKS
jgi:alpha-L-rhamnosidase